MFCFLCIWLLVCSHAFSADLVVELFSLFSVLFALLDLASLSFKSTLFRQYHYINLFKLHRDFAVLFWSFLPNISTRVFFFGNTFACCYSLFTYHFGIISHSGFVFQFRFIRRIQISSKNSIAHAEISSFSSVILTVGIFIKKLLIFSGSTKHFSTVDF